MGATTSDRSERRRVPAIEGWFRMAPGDPCLLGSRCKDCGTTFFPKEAAFCRNPACGGEELEEVELSRRGKLWSVTNNCYPPPAPYVASEPFEPYAIAAVELEAERMVVLGQVVPGVAAETLEVGTEMELVTDTLFADDESDVVVWKWRPVAG
jgi:uncharacterized OB-fold protein